VNLGADAAKCCQKATLRHHSGGVKVGIPLQNSIKVLKNKELKEIEFL